MRYGILLLAIAIAANGRAAEPNDAATAKPATTEIAALDPVFDCFRMNTAWGFALSGIMVDRQGGIYHYSMRGQSWAPAATQTDGATYYGIAELRAKFAQAQRSGSVEAKALAENVALIAKVGDGKLERSATGTRDAGSSTCHAYIRDETQRRYRDVELGSDGGVSDVRDTNGKVEAQSLLTWLKTIGVAR